MVLLNKDNYAPVLEELKKVTINNLFARSVVEQKVDGLVYADRADAPRTFYIVHPYGMSLLLGDWTNEDFNRSFSEHALNSAGSRTGHEWMQAFPAGWDGVLEKLFDGKTIPLSDPASADTTKGVIGLETRINFAFNREKFEELKQGMSPSEHDVVRTNKEAYAEMKGKVVPAYFWSSADDFFENGAGFSLYCDKKIASTAYSAFIHDDKLEIGIETVEEFRGRGFARYVCMALIDYCLEHNFEPVWACRLENRGSYFLAKKLGFDVVREIPYYRLSN